MELTWEGVTYPVPEVDPGDDRDPAKLHPAFRAALEAYVGYVNSFYPYKLHMGECYRSQERQVYLFAKGRMTPGPVRSWTLDSLHGRGLACDLYMTDADGKARWEGPLWEKLYEVAPPRWFNLEHLAPKEWVHLQSGSADEIIAHSANQII